MVYSQFRISDTIPPLVVLPQHLHFGPCHVGYLTSRNISIYNNANRDVTLTTVYDVRSVFQPGISPTESVHLKRNQKFELVVMFLPHALGDVSGTFQLFIYFSSSTVPKDVFDISASGTGQENPFKLTPLTGIRWPTSVAYSPTVSIYNPYEKELRVNEIYVSGGNLNLVPPFNEATSWYIAPYESKPIVRLNLLSDKAYNHVSYMTVKLENTPDIKLPVDVNLISSPDVFAMPTSIDFGSFSRSSPPKVVGIYLLSTYNCSTKLFSISVSNTVLHENGISITTLRESLHQSHKGMFQKVVDVTINPSKLPALADDAESRYVGNISIKFSNCRISAVNVPFTAHVYSGTFELSGFEEGFYSGEILPRLYVKKMMFTNTYDIPIAVKNIDLGPFKEEFLIEDLKIPFIVNPGEVSEFAKFSLKRQGQKFIKDFIMKIETNLFDAEYTVPVYNGDVDVTIDGKPLNVLNFELLGYNQTRYKIVKLYNKNPIKVQLLYYFTNVPFCDGYYTHLWRSKQSIMIKHEKEDAVQHQLVELNPGDFIEINVTITTPSMAHNVSGFFVIETNYDFVQLPLTFRTLEGQLLTSHLDNSEVFPGNTNPITLMITNTFNETFPIEDISLDCGSSFSLTKSCEPLSLDALSTMEVGKITFLPSKDPQFSYLMMDDLKKQKEYIKGSRLNTDQIDYELKLFKHLKGKWNNLQKNSNDKITIHGSIKSSFSDNTPIFVNVGLTWPKFVKSYDPFPVTHIKDVSVSTVTINNPSSIPVHIEAFLISSYPHSRALIDILGMRQEAVNVDDAYHLTDTSTDVFDKFFNGNDVSRKVKSFVLQSLEERSFTVEFSPTFVGTHKNILVIRNNLTLFEPLLYSAHAAKGELIFENKKHLTLSMHESLLTECHHSDEGSKEPGYFNVNRSFTLTNVGDFVSKVGDIQINGVSCSAYGITIVNCEQFELAPFATHTLKINFVPNFHYSYKEYTLSIVPVAGDTLEIPMITKIPAHLLEVCADKIERPIWEVSFRFLLVTGALCTIVVVFVQSYIFFSQPIVISQPNLKPVIIKKASDPSITPISPKKPNKKSDKTVSLQVSKPVESVPVTKSKKKKDSSKAKENIVHPIIKHDKPSPIVTKDIPKKKKSSTSKPDSPKSEVSQPKPQKMTNLVKPRIKEPIIKETEIKKPKDVNIVKPEPKRTPSLNRMPSITESKYRLSNKLSVAAAATAEDDLSTVNEAPDLQLEQKFVEAVQEEQKRKNLKSFGPLYHQTTPPWTSQPIGAQINPMPKVQPAPTGFPSYHPTTVDDWFAPNAQNPFPNLNLLSGSRQTSRFQSLFSSDSHPCEFESSWDGIWGPLSLDEGLDEHSWKTD